MKNRRQIIISIAVLFGIIILFFMVNFLARKDFKLTENQKNDLEIFYPDNHLDSISFYRGGLLSIGSTKVVCNSIYFNNEPSNDLLVHEVMHTWQSRNGCIKMIASSLFNQFKSYLKYGERNQAYFYSINDNSSEFNVEQEATLVQDFYIAAFSNKSSYFLFCEDCPNEIDNETLIKFAGKSIEILKKYE